MAQTFSLIHRKSMNVRRFELHQSYDAWKDMIAEKYVQMFLQQIGVPKFETRGWLSKTDKYYKEISDVLLEQEDWYEIVELIIGMEHWPIGHKFPAIGHVYSTRYGLSDCTQQLFVSNLKKPYDSFNTVPQATKGDYYVVQEDSEDASCFGMLSYRLCLFSVGGRLKTIIHQNKYARLCFNVELEGVLYCVSRSFGILLFAERTNSISKYLFDGRRPDPWPRY